jgi:hypothetical protein
MDVMCRTSTSVAHCFNAKDDILDSRVVFKTQNFHRSLVVMTVVEVFA